MKDRVGSAVAMKPACMGSVILAGLLAWTAMPAGCPAAGPGPGRGPPPAGRRTGGPGGGPGGQPAFWSAAGALQRALADLDGALAAGDPACLLILGEAQRSLVAVQVALRRAGTWREKRAAETGAPGSAAGEETARRMTALTGVVGRLARAFGPAGRPAAPAGGRV